jgi:hypothetical protein
LREETTEGRSERDATRGADRRREAGISGTFQAEIDGRTVHRLLWTSTLRTYIVVEMCLIDNKIHPQNILSKFLRGQFEITMIFTYHV